MHSGGCTRPLAVVDAPDSLLFLDTTRLLALERDRIHKTEAPARFRPVTRCTAGRSWNKFRLNIGLYKNSLHRRG